jgi:hypothetical protein
MWHWHVELEVMQRLPRMGMNAGAAGIMAAWAKKRGPKQKLADSLVQGWMKALIMKGSFCGKGGRFIDAVCDGAWSRVRL